MYYEIKCRVFSRYPRTFDVGGDGRLDYYFYHWFGIPTLEADSAEEAIELAKKHIIEEYLKDSPCWFKRETPDEDGSYGVFLNTYPKREDDEIVIYDDFFLDGRDHVIDRWCDFDAVPSESFAF